MKTLRRLAFLALFAVAAPAFAQTPLPAVPGGTPTPSSDTADRLGELVKGEYKGTTVEGKGDAVTFSLPKMPHTLEGGKETMQWSVYIRLHKRADRPTAVRIFFPCQAVPANAHPDRLADLMNMSGGIQDSPAYFIVSGGKDRMLTLVSEMPVAELGKEALEAEIKRLFRSAERTMGLWGGDLSKPPARKADGLLGSWKHTKLLDKNVGVVGLTLADDGTGEVSVYEVSNAPPIGKPGKYTLKGDELAFTTKEGTVFAFTVKQKGDELTVSYKENGETVTRTLTRTK